MEGEGWVTAFLYVESCEEGGGGRWGGREGVERERGKGEGKGERRGWKGERGKGDRVHGCDFGFVMVFIERAKESKVVDYVLWYMGCRDHTNSCVLVFGVQREGMVDSDSGGFTICQG